MFAETLFAMNQQGQNQQNQAMAKKWNSLQERLNLDIQDVLILDMRGEGVSA